MKKFLLSCFLALGIGASAQYTYTGDFEDPGYSTNIYKQFGGGSRTAAAACAGGFGGQLALSTTVPSTGFLLDLSQISQTGNGQKVDVTANYKKAAGIVGTISLAYYVYDAVSNQWTVIPFGTTVSLATTAITTCAQLTGTIPSGAIQPGKVYGIGAWVVRSSGTGNIFVDNINLTQETVTTAPACTAFTAPLDQSTITGGNYVFTWNAAPTAVNYNVTVGTTPGGSDVLNTVVNGNLTSLNVSLPTSATLYAKIVPTNQSGAATGCTEITFNTNTTINYCGPLTTNQPTAVAPIKSVNFAGVTNVSDPTVTTIGAFSPYQDFTSTQFMVASNTGNVPLTVKGTTNGATANGWGMSVFIDWNSDGDFDDANEQYFNTTATIVRVAGVTDNPVTLKGNITIPAGVTEGAKRMRVKYNFTGTTIHDALSTGCSQMGNGQAEDYTLVVTAPITTVPACPTILTPSDAATGVAYTPTKITWDFVNGATNFKVNIGTTLGGTDVVDGAVVAVNSYDIALSANTLYYVQVIPSNSVGDAAGCTGISFTTNRMLYCASTSSSVTFEWITNVKFGTINNATGAVAGYNNFNSLSTTVRRENSEDMIIRIRPYTSGGDYVYVFVDWNQDGLVSADEKYTLPGTTTLTAETTLAAFPITVPANAKLGATSVRVVISDSSTYTGCGTISFGEIEDYTLFVDEKLATSTVNNNAVSVYPNPFTDVLNISDVKGVKSVSIHDVSGRQVKSMKATTELNLSALKTGLYIVNLHMEDGTVRSIKAIKK